MMRSGHEAARGALQEVLRVQPPHLQVRRDRRAVLDDLVVEERHAHLERVRHRHPVEVVEHVVRQGELRVDEERRRERIVRRSPSAIAATARSAAPPSQLGERAADRAAADLCVDSTAHRQRAARPGRGAASVRAGRSNLAGACGSESHRRHCAAGRGNRFHAATSAAAWCLR